LCELQPQKKNDPAVLFQPGRFCSALTASSGARPPVGHAYRHDTEADATRAYYPYHAAEFRSTLAEVVRDHPQATYFIAGDGGFAKAAATSLANAGVERNHRRRDTYYGYTPSASSVLGRQG
jgi:hypothetical protein